jgi:hypothetical protein
LVAKEIFLCFRDVYSTARVIHPRMRSDEV